MAQSMTDNTVVRVPEGTKHYTTTVLAESWEAFDALTEADGWKQRQWCVDEDCKQVPCDSPHRARVHLHKERSVGDYSRLICFPPTKGRS